MFDKKRRNWNNATDSFILEMLRAILTEKLKTQVYLTQSGFVAGKVEQLKAKWSDRPFAHQRVQVEVQALFASLDFPRRHGYEIYDSKLHHAGVEPNSPSVRATFTFTNNEGGWFNWELYNVHMVVENFDILDANGLYDIIFEPEKLEGRNPETIASEQLVKLSKELQYRGPSRWRSNE